MDYHAVTYNRCGKIRPFGLFRQDLKAFMSSEHQQIQPGDLTRRAFVLWDTFGSLQNHYKTTAQYYKNLLRAKKRTSPNSKICIQSTKDRLRQTMGFVYSSSVYDCFSDVIRRWYDVDVSGEPQDSITCPACCYLNKEEKNPSLKVIGKFFSLGLIQAKERANNERAYFCQNCSLLLHEILRMMTFNPAVYADVDTLITRRRQDRFVSGFLQDLVHDILGDVPTGAPPKPLGKVMAVLSCCYRAGMEWGKSDVSKEDIIREMKAAERVLQPYYQWGNFFEVLSQKSAKTTVVQDLLNRFKLILGLRSQQMA